MELLADTPHASQITWSEAGMFENLFLGHLGGGYG
jgi:hypothetical protein